MTEREPIKAEIHSLLQQAETGSETVRDLARTLLKQIRADCFAALDCYQTGMMAELSSGWPDGLEDLSIERDERIVQARETLKAKLERLLRTAESKGL